MNFFKFIDSLIEKTPLAGWRTQILGYLGTTVPAMYTILQGDLTGSELMMALAWAAMGPAIQYFKNKSKV